MIIKLNELLNQALNSSGEKRVKAIRDFQNMVWNDISIQNEEINDILSDTAYILDFYEPNKEWRKEDINYYGDERLEKEIKSAIQKLQDSCDNG